MAPSRAPNNLARVRPPQVRLTYDVEVGGTVELREVPFVVGVLADLTGKPSEPLPRLRDRKFVEIDSDNFDSVLAAMKPHLTFAVENKLSEDWDAPKLKVDLSFRSLEDFEPQYVARQVTPLYKLLELRTKLADLQGTLSTNDRLQELLPDFYLNDDRLLTLRDELDQEINSKGDVSQPADVQEVQAPSIIDQIVDSAHLAIDADARRRHTEVLQAFFNDILQGNVSVSRDTPSSLSGRIASIDQLLSLQLNQILHDPSTLR